MRLHKGSASARFAYPCHLLRLLAGWMVMALAGVSMADEVTVTLSNLTHTYNGSPKPVTVTTDPPGQACTVTYEGSTTAPTNAGSYAVVVTVDAPNTGPGATGTLVINQASQTITFTTLSAKTYGNAPYALTATSSSGLPVSYMSSNPAVAQISGSTVTIMGAGSTNITASQSGDLNYLPATSVIQSQLINKASQTITFADFTKTYGDASFTLPGTSSSGLPLSYTTPQTTIVTISGTTATILKAGAANITASQAGNSNYLAATSVTKRLTVNKKTLSYSLVVPAGKTYGDAPFTVSATVSDGFSITKWESSDPSVATISPTGEVTIVGAGQTSIIGNIPSTAGTNYDPTWVARPLNVARLETLLPSPSGTETVTYDGNPHAVDPASLPAGLATETTYRDTGTPEATATPTVMFQNGPDTLDLSYDSTSFWVYNVWGQAKYMELGGTGTVGAPRKLHSCDVTLVTWAGYYGGKNNDPTYRFKEWADANPALVVVPTPGVSIPGVDSGGYPIPGNSGGWYHPVTLSFYEYDIVSGTESYRLLTSKTVQAFIPWRPEKLADNVTPYTQYNGYAFRVPFDFPEGVILPDQVWVAVSFNTQSSGVAPIGVAGPYNALNSSVPAPQPTPPNPQQQAGTTLYGTKHYKFVDWRWQQVTETRGPMLRLRTVPTNATLAAPVNAGNYEVKTQATAFGADGVSTSMLQINKAPLDISLSNLTQVRDGGPKPVTVSTTPGAIAISVTYNGSTTAPSALGSYPVTATSANPNYEGQANGTLRIGDTYASWRNATFAGSGLPAEQITDNADPDGDGLRNFLEYASNFNPLLGGQPSPTGLEQGGATMAFTYRRNLHALDLDYRIEGSSQLADPLSWAPVTPLSEIPLSDDGATRVIQATVAKPAGPPCYFLRLKAAPP